MEYTILYFSLQLLVLNIILIGKGSLHNGYLDNFDNEFSNKYEKIFKKTLCVCYSTYRLMVI
jgi:hypothetical protein